MSPLFAVDGIPWRPHPLVKEANIKPLATKSEDGLDVTFLPVRFPAGVEIKHPCPKRSGSKKSVTEDIL